MGVESFTNVQSLNENWPLGTDPRSEGDDHIRGIKKVLKATDGGALTSMVMTVKTTSGTYTKPATLKFLEVEGVGGGGGAAGANAAAAGQGAASGGGGAGAYGKRLFTAAELGATTPYTIGARGAGTATAGGGTGGTSEFGTGLSCTLGGGTGSSRTGVATTFTQIVGGAGGASGGGWTVRSAGEQGHTSVACFSGTAIGLRGVGGRSFFAPHGGQDQYFGGAAGGIDTGGIGAGGGGSRSHSGAAQQTGGNGGAAVFFFTEYF
jgi:hypothetical protein